MTAACQPVFGGLSPESIRAVDAAEAGSSPAGGDPQGERQHRRDRGTATLQSAL